MADELAPDKTIRSTISNRFAGSSHGACVDFQGQVSCRYAYGLQTPTRVEAPERNGDCTVPTNGQIQSIALRFAPAGTNPDPVWNEPLAFATRVCSGDTISFTEYEPIARIRLATGPLSVKLQEFVAR